MKIGLTYTGSDEKHRNYVNWLKGDDELEVVMLRADVVADGSTGTDPLAGGISAEELLKDCDALVLSGGIDIYPGFYGKDTQYPNGPVEWNKERDLMERGLFEWALADGMPVLGVCRGLQLINTSLNGTLVRDLGEERNKTHQNEGAKDKQHGVAVEEESLLGEIAGEKSGIVNSAHHQAIERLGEGLKVNCRAVDGTIEGIEWEDPAGKSFLLGIQWHPERMFTQQLPDTFLYRKIRNRLIEEAKMKRI